MSRLCSRTTATTLLQPAGCPTVLGGTSHHGYSFIPSHAELLVEWRFCGFVWVTGSKFPVHRLLRRSAAELRVQGCYGVPWPHYVGGARRFGEEVFRRGRFRRSSMNVVATRSRCDGVATVVRHGVDSWRVGVAAALVRLHLHLGCRGCYYERGGAVEDRRLKLLHR